MLLRSIVLIKKNSFFFEMLGWQQTLQELLTARIELEKEQSYHSQQAFALRTHDIPQTDKQIQLMQTRIHHPVYQFFSDLFATELIQLCEEYLDFDCCTKCHQAYGKGAAGCLACVSTSTNLIHKNVRIGTQFYQGSHFVAPFLHWQHEDIWMDWKMKNIWNYMLYQWNQMNYVVASDRWRDDLYKKQPKTIEIRIRRELSVNIHGLHFEQYRVEFVCKCAVSYPDLEKYIVLRCVIVKPKTIVLQGKRKRS